MSQPLYPHGKCSQYPLDKRLDGSTHITELRKISPFLVIRLQTMKKCSMLAVPLAGRLNNQLQ
jgi:hypothetical protein